jgi:hypothetical protein
MAKFGKILKFCQNQSQLRSLRSDHERFSLSLDALKRATYAQLPCDFCHGS